MIATKVEPQDQIQVSLTAVKPDGTRIPINLSFNGQGEAIDFTGKPNGAPGLSLAVAKSDLEEPKFPMDSYVEAIKDGEQDAADQIHAEYSEALASFRAAGGADTPTAVVNAVLSYLRQYHNVREEDHSGPVVKREQVLVSAAERNGQDAPVIWLVQLTPTWGGR